MKTQASFRQVLHPEHASLAETLQGPERMRDLSPGERPAAAVDQLRPQPAQLAEQFAFEEQGGYMALVLERLPHVNRTVQELLSEHHRLARSLDALLDEAQAAASKGRLEGAFRERVREWAASVHRPEARENRLVQDACNRDLAAED
jgi:hypothetical protein